MALMWRALPYIDARRLFSVAMPNAYNFAFDYGWFMRVRGVGRGWGRMAGCRGRLLLLCPQKAERKAPSSEKNALLDQHTHTYTPTHAKVVLVAYPYLWWGLYSTLLRQRRKRLGAQAAEGEGEGGGDGGASKKRQ
jgi:hypothetical protein